MNQDEQRIRTRLSIPDSAKYVLVIDQSAHMDWDWRATFEQYFWTETGQDPPTSPVDTILTEAVQQLLQPVSPQASDGPSADYYYSICEMGYFRRFVEAHGHDVLTRLRACGDRLRVVGGGITSPDCLLTSGEGFIRNYLLGERWLATVLPEHARLRHCWLPDDFGHDPELPVGVQALGMQSITFSRLPGFPPSGSSIQNHLLRDQLTRDGVDFLWAASDHASAVQTHWMPGTVPGYFQGGGLANAHGDSSAVVSAICTFLMQYTTDCQCVPPFSGAPSNYLYLPLDDDFMSPIADLLDEVAAWNTSEQSKQPDQQVYAVEASYGDFADLVAAAGQPLRSVAYNGTPYYTGYYASRPELKILHYRTTRSLLAAEAFGLLASRPFASTVRPLALDPLFWDRVAQAWGDFAPSTHHDYVCGTALDSVTAAEQLPLLRTAHAEAHEAAGTALAALAASLPAAPGAMVVANPAGLTFSGVVELPGPVPPDVHSATFGAQSVPVQPSLAGGLLMQLDQVPSLGYVTGTLSSPSAPVASPAQLQPAESDQATYTLSNGLLEVTIDAQSSWGISSIRDAAGVEQLAQSGVANQLILYQDAGNLYQFGNELGGSTSDFTPVRVDVTTSGDGLGARVLESGPLRVRLETVVSISAPAAGVGAAQYVREYCLVAGEPWLRMRTTGAAPSGYSVMVAFPLAQAVSSIVHGTPLHWTAVQPWDGWPETVALWPAPVFRATHDFALAYAGQSLVGGIYHKDVPAWAYDTNGVLLGCVLRNTPGGDRAAAGTDPDVHSLEYAFRVATGLRSPDTGAPLREALAYTRPPHAALITGLSSGVSLSGSGSIASVSEPGVMLCAKPAEIESESLVLRLYQPTNSPVSLEVTLGRGQPRAAVAITALEHEIEENAPAIQLTNTGFTINVQAALTTVQVSY